jgi:hypothetical protein
MLTTLLVLITGSAGVASVGTINDKTPVTANKDMAQARTLLCLMDCMTMP